MIDAGKSRWRNEVDNGGVKTPNVFEISLGVFDISLGVLRISLGVLRVNT